MNLLRIFLFSIIMTLSSVSYASASKGISIIRDHEIEEYINIISKPIFTASGLNPKDIKIFIVNDLKLNAFVSGGQNMFINAGLIIEDDDPNMLMGVIAHEAGHIAGGHLVRKSNASDDFMVESAIGYALGIASIAAGAPPNASLALISGGQHIAQRNFLKYSRSQEEAADQAALTVMKKLQISPKGLVKLLKTLGGNYELNKGQSSSPYLQSHPSSPERISHINASINIDIAGNKKAHQTVIDQHNRIQSKLLAFLKKPQDIIEILKNEDNIAAQYGLAIAYHRLPDLQKAISTIDKLIAKEPSNPYFHELKGQIYLEHGKVKKSIAPYKKAVELSDDAPLIISSLASSLIASENIRLIKIAIKYLEIAILKEPKNATIWHQLGIAYGRDNQLGQSYIALAEESNIKKDDKQTKIFIKQANKYIDKNGKSSISLRLNDLMNLLKVE